MIQNGFTSQQVTAAHEAIAAMNDSPLQQKLAREGKWFASVVLWRPGDYEMSWLVDQLTRIKQTGLTSVRYHNLELEETSPGVYDLSRMDDWMAAAEKVDIDVIAHIGSLRPSEALLAKHGVDPQRFQRSHLRDPESRAALAQLYQPVAERYKDHPNLLAWGMAGEPNAGDSGIDNDYDRVEFARWLEKQYGTLEKLDEAWNLYPEAGKYIVESFQTAYRALEGFQADWKVSGAHRAQVNYGAARDVLRYLTDKMNTRIVATVESLHKFDPDTPVNLGAHQLFLNQPQLRWDIRQFASRADLFTTSIHLSWHFEAACGEVDRPVYFQSRQTRDYFKGGWTSAYETTGGAVQYSGGYPNSMNPGLMRRLMCNYLAAGHVNIAFWTWNNRPGGWEAGEYGMTSLSGKVTSWASQAGQIARAMGKYHRELWSARQENPVGVLEDWDTQAVYTLEPDRHDLTDGPGRFGGGTQLQPIWAMIGASRALVNHHRAFQYVRTEELGDGIGPAYPVLYAPHLRALSTEALENLLAYVEAGGRLVADVQFGFQDPWGKCHPAGEGGPVERIFGAWIDVIHHTRTEQMQLGDMSIDGYFADVETTDAKVLARFADGRAAVTEVRRGKGSAVLVGFDLARMCTRPGNAQAEAYLAQLTTGHMQRTWQCDAPLAFRLRSQQADHYFLINDGPARAAFIQAFDRQYTEGVDAITGEPVDVAQSMVIDLPAESACWIRLA